MRPAKVLGARGCAVLVAPVLALSIFAVSDARGSAVPAANTDPPPRVDVGVDSFVSANQSRCVTAPGAAPGDVAVVNITNTQADGRGWGALRPFGETPVYNRPATAQYSSVNFAADTPPNPNLAFTTVGAGGQFCYDGARADHNVALDLAAVIPAANVNAVTPSRLLDTRGGALVTANSSRCVGVPGASVGDVAVVNITNTRAAGSGWGAVRSSDDTPVSARPTSSQYSSVNFAANTPPNPNLAVTEVGADGAFCYDGAIASHHVLLDLAAVIPAANVDAVTPTRLLDTRTSGGLVAANSSRCVEVSGAGDGDVAVVNITNTQAQGRGWGALRSPSDTAVYSRPTSSQYSSVNFAANTRPNPNLSLAVIDGGQFCYDGAIASHHVALDLAAVIPAANVNAITPTRVIDTRNEPPDNDATTTTTTTTVPPTGPPTVPPRTDLDMTDRSLQGPTPQNPIGVGPPTLGTHALNLMPTPAPGGYGRWGPCDKIITFAVNAERATQAGVDNMFEAIRAIEAATGFDLVPYRTNPLTAGGLDFPHQVEGADALLAFSDPSATPRLDGSVIGVGGAIWSPTEGQATGGFALVDVSDTGDESLPVFLHEMGHMLGLGHVNDATEIMYPVNQGRTTLGPGDQEGLWRLGTSQSCFPSALLAKGPPPPSEIFVSTVERDS